MRQPTARQLAVLRFIAECVARGLPPSQHEMRTRFRWKSPNASRDHVAALIRHGLLTQGPHGSKRTLALTESGWFALGGRDAFATNAGAANVRKYVFTSKPPTGYVDPPAARCAACRRVFFGRSFDNHACVPACAATGWRQVAS